MNEHDRSDFENNGSGSLFGFDSAETANKQEPATGYTLTPEGGFFGDSAEEKKAPNPQNENKTSEQSSAPNNSYAGFQSMPMYSQSVYYNKPKRPKKEKRVVSFYAVIAAVLIAAIVGAGAGVGSVLMLSRFNKPETNESFGGSTTNQITNITVDKTASNIVEAVAEKVTPSVVGIRTTVSVNSFFFGNSEQSGEGSGIIYTKDGYIITNYHVISEAVEAQSGKIEVFLSKNTDSAIPASVVGYNISSDLAVIKVDRNDLVPVELGNSENLKVGEFVIAIGNPGGLEYMSSVTYGIVSGLNRSVSSEKGKASRVEYIQTDAAINPGNSGGALVNTEGKLVGVNSVKIVSESYEGMGFSIPVNAVVEICNKIIEKQDDPSPYLGITISERYDSNTLNYLGFPDGAVVSGVDEGSPADDAGIKRGDIITELAGIELSDYNDYSEALHECEVGKKITCKIYRSGRTYSATIKVGSDNSVK